MGTPTPMCAAVFLLLWNAAVQIQCNAQKDSAVNSVIQQQNAECSGHGIQYPDTDFQCECFQCFKGLNCETPIDPCIVISTGGNPLVFQSYWEQYDITTQYGVHLETGYRTGYQFGVMYPPTGSYSGIGAYLNKAIRNLHTTVGNADTEGYSIVIGAGCTNLIAAATYALQSTAGKPMNVFAQTPYYEGYKNWADLNPNLTNFNASLLLDPHTVIEFVTLPNNPDGKNRKQFYNTSYGIHDMVYYWPSLVNDIESQSFPIMLFSLSKLSGHAGSRFGWALVKDPQIAKSMANFIGVASIAISIDTQYRAMRIIEAITNDKDSFFPFIQQKLGARWSMLQEVFSEQSPSDRFTLSSVPGTFYGWIQCNQAEGKTCFQVFQEYGIIGEPGETFGAEPGKFIRLEMVERDTSFDVLIHNLRKLMTGTH